MRDLRPRYPRPTICVNRFAWIQDISEFRHITRGASECLFDCVSFAHRSMKVAKRQSCMGPWTDSGSELISCQISELEVQLIMGIGRISLAWIRLCVHGNMLVCFSALPDKRICTCSTCPYVFLSLLSRLGDLLSEFAWKALQNVSVICRFS